MIRIAPLRSRNPANIQKSIRSFFAYLFSSCLFGLQGPRKNHTSTIFPGTLNPLYHNTSAKCVLLRLKINVPRQKQATTKIQK